MIIQHTIFLRTPIMYSSKSSSNVRDKLYSFLLRDIKQEIANSNRYVVAILKSSGLSTNLA